MAAASILTKCVEVPKLPFHNKLFRAAASSYGAADVSPSAFSAMQFNLLANCFTPKHTSDVMTFQDRVALNLGHINAMKPSLLVLQEADADYFPPLEASGYRKVCAQKKDPSEGNGEFTAVFTREGSGLDCKSLRVCKIDPTGRRSQFAFFMHFVFTQQLVGGFAPPYEFIAIAFHAKAGRSDELETERLRDADYMLRALLPEFALSVAAASAAGTSGGGDSTERLQRLLAERVLWMGDFNSGPQTYGGKYPARMIPWLLGEEMEESEKKKFDEIAASSGAVQPPVVKLVSAFKTSMGRHPLFTTCKHREGSVICQTIDYILMSPGLGKVTGCLGDPTDDPTNELMPTLLPCPNKWGSDHLSAYVEIDVQQAMVAEYNKNSNSSKQ